VVLPHKSSYYCQASVAHAYNPEIKRISAQRQPRQIIHKTLSQKNPPQKRAGGVAHGVEHLSSKHEALNSNPSAKKVHTPYLVFSSQA
jgi:hypothetical protein